MKQLKRWDAGCVASLIILQKRWTKRLVRLARMFEVAIPFDRSARIAYNEEGIKEVKFFLGLLAITFIKHKYK